MTFILTLIYVALIHLSPAEWFPSLGTYHVMQWLAIGAILLLTLRVQSLSGMRSPHVGLMLGFLVAIALSRLSHLWLGGVVPGLFEFIKSGIPFFLVLATVNNVRRLRILCLVLAVVAMGLLGQSLLAAPAEDGSNQFVTRYPLDPDSVSRPNELARIQSVGLLEDPNDFAQYLLVGTSLLLIAWRPGRRFTSVLVVAPPALALLYGIYLTHSRGALVGVAMLVFMLVRRRVGKTGGVFLAAMMLVVATGIEARPISATEPSAAGRLMAWGTGIAMLKDSPIFGSGFGTFLADQELTAHNSFVLCFAELGLFGYFFWLALIIFSWMDLDAVIRSLRGRPEHAQLWMCAVALEIALATFLATAWFLSRTYVPTFYVLIGAAAVVRQLAPRDVPAAQTLRGRWPLVATLEFASIIAVYASVLLRTL